MTAPTPRPTDALLARYDRPGPRYTSYPTAPEWRAEFGAQDLARALTRAAQERPDAPLSMYVHLPFCHSLCWYCGCNVVIAKESAAAERYLEHLGKELALTADRLGTRRTLGQIHWGGGTPTFLSEGQIERLWKDITSHFQVAPGAEVAIEVHPSFTSESQLTTLRKLGFNRISMGLQDFDPLVQEATRRIQTEEQTRTLLEQARALGFSGINFDLIYGLPHQTPERWGKTLQKVAALAPDRLAVYSFAFMPELLKHQNRMPKEAIPAGPQKLELLLMVREHFMTLGYQAIGMDHFARPDDELARAVVERRLGRNFQGYTVAAADEVVAVGSTGISDVGGAYAQNVRALPRYYERVAKGEFATERGLWLSDDDRARRRIIQSVMCNFWVDLGQDVGRYQEALERLRPMEEDGLVKVSGSTLEVTPLGQLFVRNVAMVFDTYLPKEGAKRFSRTV
jgi:oxygen-independent coproporphyrinogen III oxidase